MVRRGILGDSERKALEAFLKGERVKGYTTLLTRVRQIGLGQIIKDSEHDLWLLKKLDRLWAKEPD